MKTGKFWILLVMAFIACSFGCSRKEYTDYAQRAYLDEREDCFDTLAVPLQDEVLSDNLLLELGPCLTKDEWLKQPCETIEEWLNRLRRELLANQDLIHDLHNELKELKEEKGEYNASIKSLIDRNEQLRAEASNLPEDEVPQQSVASLPPAPFTIHVVQRGETLHSIAMKHYGDDAMIESIMLWNQGWLRAPHELIAGMGLVLFPSETQENSQEVVDRYLQETAASALQTSVE